MSTADQAGYNSCLQEQMVTLTPPTSSPQCLAGNDSNSTSAPISPTGAVRNGGRSKKRKYGDIEDGNVQTKERVHDGPRRIEDLSGPEHQKLQELIEAARDEMVQLQQEVKRLGARILELEQGRESQGRSLTKAPAMTEECKDMPGFRRGWVAALQSINW